jgi:hypothetical protein
MGGSCSTYGGKKRRVQNFGEKNLMERDHLENISIYGRIILK